MPRIRNIKPGFFKDEDLADLSFGHRLLFAGLWTLADKHGTLEDRPRFIKAELFPYDALDVDAFLADLVSAGFLLRYRVAGKGYLHIPTFTKHQRISGDELKFGSALPLPDAADEADEAGTKQGRSSQEAGTKQVRSMSACGVRSTEYGVLSTDTRTETPRASVLPLVAKRTLNPWESAIGLDVVPRLHREFAAKLTNAGVADADAVLWAWYRDTEKAYTGQEIGEDAFDFWRQRFKEWRGTTAKHAAAPVVDDWTPPVRKGGTR